MLSTRNYDNADEEEVANAQSDWSGVFAGDEGHFVKNLNQDAPCS